MRLLRISERLYKYIRALGIKAGVLVYLKTKTNNTKNISLPNIKHSIELRSGTSDIPTFYQIFISEEYKMQLGFSPQSIIDAGANIGLATIYFANKYPDSKIVSIEPEISNYQLLKRNTRHYPNVFTINKGLSNNNQTLNIVNNGYGNWGFMTLKIEDKNKESMKNTTEAITVPQIKKQYCLEYIDIVKIDIEGFEKEVFESNYESWIPKTRCIIIEIHDRMKPGCSTSFFKCISKYDFTFSMKGENLVFINNKLKTTHNDV